MRVPLMHAFPWQISGSVVMRVRQSMGQVSIVGRKGQVRGVTEVVRLDDAVAVSPEVQARQTGPVCLKQLHPVG